jgi:hypothetical protein
MTKVQKDAATVVVLALAAAGFVEAMRLWLVTHPMSVDTKAFLPMVTLEVAILTAGAAGKMVVRQPQSMLLIYCILGDRAHDPRKGILRHADELTTALLHKPGVSLSATTLRNSADSSSVGSEISSRTAARLRRFCNPSSSIASNFDDVTT